jgi:pimeloyl-ACP methyl ester carboxylesterase
MPFDKRVRVPTNGITLDVGLAGPADGPPVLLLHGFPDTAHSCWLPQVPALAAAGWRVIAPDQRGYGKSDKPANPEAYHIDTLVSDARGVLAALGHPAAIWIGHDWGGAVTWRAAERHPEAVRRFVVLNCPHPAELAQRLRRDPLQALRSTYMLLFQLPGVAEAVLAGGALERGYVRGHRTPVSPGELAALRTAWSETGALSGMLAWYRAGRALLRRSRPPDDLIRPPALLVWGRKDAVLAAAMAQPSIDRCRQGRLVWIDDAGHWVHHDAAGRVDALLAGFCAADEHVPSRRAARELVPS